MQFILAGFTHDSGFRVFTFERIGADQRRTGFVVRTDLALTQRYGIRLQELPLLCQGLLERRDEGEQARTFTFTEAEMLLYANSCVVEREARQGNKSMHRPPGKPVGTASRTLQPWSGYRPVVQPER
jgi:hypothetical protein